MNRVLYTSLFIPPDWIAAHGLAPSRVIGTDAASRPGALGREGVCPFLRSFVSEVTTMSDGLGVVMTTTCDQMRRAVDLVAQQGEIPVCLVNIPSTWQSKASRELYYNELHRLGRFLVSRGGTHPSDERLAEVMLHYDQLRASLKNLADRLPPRGWAEVAEAFQRTNALNRLASADIRAVQHTGVPVALLGGPRRQEDRTLFDLITAAGGYVALDASDNGMRGLCRPFDPDRVRDDPFKELADAYFDSIVDVSRRPNDGFYQWLEPRLQKRAIGGIILHRYLWCDLWHAEVERIRQRFGLPLLDLDLDGEDLLTEERTRTRIGAFLEMLR